MLASLLESAAHFGIAPVGLPFVHHLQVGHGKAHIRRFKGEFRHRNAEGLLVGAVQGGRVGVAIGLNVQHQPQLDALNIEHALPLAGNVLGGK